MWVCVIDSKNAYVCVYLHLWVGKSREREKELDLECMNEISCSCVSAIGEGVYEYII